MASTKFFTLLLSLLLTVGVFPQDKVIPIEAENADSLRSDFNIIIEGDITYITPATDFANANSPYTSNKVATYQITFPDTGFYNLFVHLRVGSGNYNDDSFFMGKDSV